MTKEEWAARLPLIQAFVEGKTIQVNYDGPWEDIDFKDVSFDSEIEHYRIKPEPKVIWVNEYDDDSYTVHSSKEDAIKTGRLFTDFERLAVKYVEVME